MTDDVVTSETPEGTCPNCHAKVDRATSMSGNRPVPGDVSICAYCRHIGIFDATMRPREPTEEELKAMAGMPELRQYTDALADSPFADVDPRTRR